jgi:hypothetical protein
MCKVVKRSLAAARRAVEGQMRMMGVKNVSSQAFAVEQSPRSSGPPPKMVGRRAS